VVVMSDLLLVGGKGGVGKTTIAAATALRLAAGERRGPVLVVSTDPAHSLGDAFGMSLRSPDRNPIGIQPGLDGWELCAQELARDFLGKHGATLHELVERGTVLDEGDVDQFFSLTLPGIDEVTAVLEIARLVGEGRYDVIVVDTAPTGHTMRLLSLPDEMASWVQLLDRMQEKYRYMTKRFSGRVRNGAGDRFIREMSGDIAGLSSLLADPQRTGFVPVLIPEAMAVNETRRLLRFLERRGIRVDPLVVNRVPPLSDCPRCTRRYYEACGQLKAIAEAFAGYERKEVPLLPLEPGGLEGLEQIASLLFGGSEAIEPPRRAAARTGRSRGPSADLSGLLRRPIEVLLFGGKGGVGKTSVAAAMALQRARENTQERTLLFSTDPAHSISDSLDQPIGDTVVQVGTAGRLCAIEIDAAALLTIFKKDYQEAIEEAFSQLLGKQADLPFDRPVMQGLVDAAPAGLDELMALCKLLDLADDFDLFILDTAPTGHLLRFLETPEIVASWLKVIFRMLLKYRDLLSLDRLAEDLVQLSRRIRRIRALLADAERTAFVAVAIPETLAVQETRRLLSGVSTAGISCRQLVVNMVVPRSGCLFCEARREEQARSIEALADLDPLLDVIYVPAFSGEIHGLEGLRHLGEALTGTHVPAEESA
jgi:arsenite-transporting ATPase